MRTDSDFAPYRPFTVDFGRLFDLLETGMRGTEAPDAYPPFDIVREGEDSYRITLAVAGFRPDEIEIVAQQNQLVVAGKQSEDSDKREYCIATSRRAPWNAVSSSPIPSRSGTRASTKVFCQSRSSGSFPKR